MKPKYLKQYRGLATVLTIVTSAYGQTTWNGAGTDWNTGANWTPNGVPTNNVFINTDTPNIATISATISATPVDIFVGDASATGRLDHTAGNASTGNGNWLTVGRNAGNKGIYNLADTTTVGTGITGYAQGSGSMTPGNTSNGGRLYIGRDGGEGIVNVNTTGSLTIRNDLYVANGTGGKGTLNIENGTVSSGSSAANAWQFIGGGGTSNGTLNMSGGSLTGWGRFNVADGGSSVGTVTISGTAALYQKTGESFRIGNGGTSNGSVTQSGAGSLVDIASGELWIAEGGGTGSYTISAGQLNVRNWFAVGRNSGKGTLNVSGGTITKSGGGSFTMGSLGANGTATVNISGGLIDCQTGNALIAEGGTNTVTTFTMTGGELKLATGNVQIGAGGSATGNANFDGGTLRTASIVGGTGTASNADFNGTQIIATSTNPNFISNLDIADVQTGGLLVDSQAFDLASSQAFTGSGSLTKSGSGSLTLSGASTYSGSSNINAGKLVLPTKQTGGGDISVADTAHLGVTVTAYDEQLNAANATFGTAGASQISIDLAGFGNPSNAPLNVVGTLTANGTVTVNVASTFLSVGTVPLIKYGSSSTSANFVLGTLPAGVVATLVDNTANGSIDLNVTAVADLEWEGDVAGQVWDINTTANWIDQNTNAAAVFQTGNPVEFNDNATGYAPVLNTAVSPSAVVFNNATTYTLTGSGSIGGTTGLVKNGAGIATVNTANTYDGVTAINAGTLSVNSIANGGAASSIGDSSSAASNLLLGTATSSATLDYTGANASSDRGITITGTGNTINTANNLTLSGSIVGVTNQLFKTGAGTLTFANAGTFTVADTATTGTAPLEIREGTLAFSAAGQIANVNGEIWVGDKTTSGGNLVINAGTLNCSSWMAVGRGNGDIGNISSVTATNAVVNTQHLSTGFDNGLPNDSDQNITITSTAWTTNDATLLAESTKATTNFVIEGNTEYLAKGRFLTALGTDSICNVTVKDSGKLTNTGGWFSIGNSNNGVATFTAQDNAIVSVGSDLNIGDVGTSNGTLIVKNSASFSSTSGTFVGKNTGTTGAVNISGGTITTNNIFIGNATGANGSVTQSGGAFVGNGNDFQIGATGTGVYTISAGSLTVNQWLVLGRNAGGVGTLNVSGGTVAQTAANRHIIIGEEGTGTVNISSTGVVNATNPVRVSQGAASVGTLNLDGGTLNAPQVLDNGGTSTVNFNGGVLKATAASATFVTGIDTATILAGGAFIDSNANAITIPVVLSGTGALTKQGSDTLTLSAANTYTGNTTVSAGTLSLGVDYLADTSTVTIDTGALLNLTHTAIDQVDALVIGGVSQADGVYGAIGSGAQFEDAAITGTGKIRVGAPVGYTGWIAGTFANGTVAPGDQGPLADPDGDGLSNALEYAFDGNDPTVGNGSLGTLSGMTVTFTKRADAVANGDVTYAIEESTDLGLADAWTDVTPTVDNSTTISYTFPGVDPRDFVRAKVTITP